MKTTAENETDLSAFTPGLQQWLRAQVERAEREPDWLPDGVALPPPTSLSELMQVNSWLMKRFSERIRRRRESQPMCDIPEFVL